MCALPVGLAYVQYLYMYAYIVIVFSTVASNSYGCDPLAVVARADKTEICRDSHARKDINIMSHMCNITLYVNSINT